MLWWTPGTAAGWAPVSVFGGRVLAGWLVFATALATAVCLVPVADSGPARLVVAAQPVAWCLAGLRTPQTFADHPLWIGYCAVLAVLGLLGVDAFRHTQATVAAAGRSMSADATRYGGASTALDQTGAGTGPHG